MRKLKIIGLLFVVFTLQYCVYDSDVSSKKIDYRWNCDNLSDKESLKSLEEELERILTVENATDVEQKKFEEAIIRIAGESGAETARNGESGDKYVMYYLCNKVNGLTMKQISNL